MNASASRAAFDAARPFHPPFDATVLNSGRRTPPVWPSELFSLGLSTIADDFAGACSAPIDYIGATILAVAAAAIGGSRRVETFVEGGWSEPSIIWTALVGDPSSAKSPAIDVVTRPLHAIEVEQAERFQTDTMRSFNTDYAAAKSENEKWEAQVKMAVKDGVGVPLQPASAMLPVKPARPRLVIKDATPEAVQAILPTNRRLLCNRDELSGFLDFDRYNSGGRSYWLEAYGGRELTVDRKSADGPIIIPFNGVSVCGGIQPDKLAEVFKGADDGLAARFLLVWPESTDYEPPRATADAAQWEAMIRALHGLQMRRDADGREHPAMITMEPDARAHYVDWRKQNARSGDDGGPLFKGMVGKMPGFVVRLAMILELLDWAEVGGREPKTVCLTAMVRAVAFVERYAKPMALRVFGDAALPQVERNAATIARMIVAQGLTRINLSALRAQGLAKLREADALAEAADFLVDAGWLTFAGDRAGPTAGRKSKDYAVNPGVHALKGKR